MILSIMFLLGTAMACRELVKWWKARMEQYEPPPLANLITYVPGPERRWRAAEVLRFLVAEKIRSIRGRFEHFFQSIDKDRPTKAA